MPVIDRNVHAKQYLIKNHEQLNLLRHSLVEKQHVNLQIPKRHRNQTIRRQDKKHHHGQRYRTHNLRVL